MSSGSGWPRRAVLRAALGAGVVVCAARPTVAQTGDPRTQRPQAGDRFVFAGGERIGQVITLGDLLVGRPPLLGYPFDPGSRVVRDGSRLNQILLVRLAPNELGEETRRQTGEGGAGYS